MISKRDSKPFYVKFSVGFSNDETESPVYGNDWSVCYGLISDPSGSINREVYGYEKPFDKTITVKVETYKKHPLYGKRVKYSKKYAAHDENNIAHVGDKVRLAQTRPLSKTKRYELVEVIEKAVIL